MDFSEFIDLINLVDIPSKGKKFTWFGGNGKARSSIDRFLVANNMVNKLGIVSQLAGDWDISDHCSIWMIFDRADWGPKPFKVNNESFSNRDFFRLGRRNGKIFWWKGEANMCLKKN